MWKLPSTKIVMRNSNTLATWCKELSHLKRPWCSERLRAGGERDDKGWDDWMASPTQWIWILVNSRSWWWTGRPGMLHFMGLQRVGHDWTTELNWAELTSRVHHSKYSITSNSWGNWVPERVKRLVLFVINGLWYKNQSSLGIRGLPENKVINFLENAGFYTSTFKLGKREWILPFDDDDKSRMMINLVLFDICIYVFEHVYVCAWVWSVCVCVCVCVCAQEREIPASEVPLCRTKMLFTDIYLHILTY